MTGNLLSLGNLFFSQLAGSLSFASLSFRWVWQFIDLFTLLLNSFLLPFKLCDFLGKFLKCLQLVFLLGVVGLFGHFLQLFLKDLFRIGQILDGL